MSDTTTPPPPADEKPARARAADDDTSGYAIYDLKFLRFVTGPMDGNKPAATAELKSRAKAAGRKADEFEVRAV